MLSGAEQDHNGGCCLFTFRCALRAALLRGALVCLALAALAPGGQAAELTEDPTVHPALWPQRAPPALSPETEAFVSALLARMSLEEKVAQMIQADVGSLTAEDLRTYKLGAVLAGGGAAPSEGVRAQAGAWLDLADSLYRAAMQPNTAAHAPIPILFGVDAVHGHAKIRGATIFPHNIGLGAAHDPQLVERIG